MSRLREQAVLYGATLKHDRVTTLRRGEEGGFIAQRSGSGISARTVLLATGLVDASGLEPSIYTGAIRFCLTRSKRVKSAAHTLGLKLHVLYASNERDFEAVFAGVARLQAGALVVVIKVMICIQLRKRSLMTFARETGGDLRAGGARVQL